MGERDDALEYGRKVLLEQTNYLLNRGREETRMSGVLTMVYYTEGHMAFGFRSSFDLPEIARYLTADSYPLERIFLACG